MATLRVCVSVYLYRDYNVPNATNAHVAMFLFLALSMCMCFVSGVESTYIKIHYYRFWGCDCEAETMPDFIFTYGTRIINLAQCVEPGPGATCVYTLTSLARSFASIIFNINRCEAAIISSDSNPLGTNRFGFDLKCQQKIASKGKQ